VAVLLATDDADLDLGTVRDCCDSSSSSRAMLRFSSSGTFEPSYMCDWNVGRPPFLTCSTSCWISGRTQESRFCLVQWSVCMATVMEYFFATSAA
jgi:hypothetical protein